ATGQTGHTGPTGETGATGTIIQCICISLNGNLGPNEPSTVGSLTPINGDYYLQVQSVGDCNLFQYVSGLWVDRSNLVGVSDDEGNQVTFPFYFMGINVVSGFLQIYEIENLAPDECHELILRIGD